jgi:hypothetical protein
MNSLRKTVFVAAVIFVSCAFSQAQETGGAKGKVRTAQDRGIAGVIVTAEQNGKSVRSASTDKSGNFTINGLKSGRYNLVFAKQGFATGTLNNVEVGDKKIRDIGNRLLEVDEGALVLVRGSVFDQNGKSVYGAKVNIEKVSGDDRIKVPKPYYTTESGDFYFRFPEGTAKFRVTASIRGKSVSKDVEVDSAAIYRLALTLNIAEKSEKEQN